MYNVDQLLGQGQVSSELELDARRLEKSVRTKGIQTMLVSYRSVTSGRQSRLLDKPLRESV